MTNEEGLTRDAFPPRLTPRQATDFSAQPPPALKRLRQKREIRFYRTGHRSVVYDRDSLANWLLRHEVKPLGES